MIRRASARLPAPAFRPLQHCSGRVAVPAVVSLLLVLALLGRGVIGWLDLSQDSAAVAEVERPIATARPVDLAALQQLRLFARDSEGAAVAADQTQAAQQSTIPVQQTMLDLRLEGIMLAATPAASRAVIASGGQQRSYRIGETLSGNSAVTLHDVARDHVVIDNRGRREVLALRTAPAGASSPAPVAVTPAAAVAAAPVVYLQDYATASAALAELMQITPAQANGTLIGLRLEPGKRLKDFVKLGFRTGDVVTAINDIPMTDMSKLPQLYGLLQGSAAVSFSLLRDGQPQTLQITLPAPLTPAGL